MNQHFRNAILAALFVCAAFFTHVAVQSAEEKPASAGQPGDLAVTLTDLPKGMVFLNGAALPDGTWWQEWYDPDSGLAYECRRLNDIRPTDDAVRRFLRMEWPEAHGVRVNRFPEAAGKITYPVSQVWFLTGRNEDTRLHLGAMVFCDDWSFWLDTSLPADDAAVDDDNMPVDLRRILLSMELVSGGNEALPSGSIVLTGPDVDTPPSTSNEIMTSLIRLLDETRPHNGAAPEFHYEGIRMISLHGLAVHAFVGIDGDGEHYYGVDKRGLVYRMGDDGSYDTIREFDNAWPDETPFWWGEYRNGGGDTLFVREFREGPGGFYIRFSFVIDGEETTSDLAEVDEDEHTAFTRDLVFRIDDAAETITVTGAEDDEAAEASPAAWVAAAPGVYTRAR